MRIHILKAIYKKEVLDLVRDRRTLISMIAVPILVMSADGGGHAGDWRGGKEIPE